MRELTAQLHSDLRLTATVAHNGSMGSARERVVRNRLGPYLPSQFVTATGTAINTKGGRSRELDAMIIDGTAGRPFVNVGGESVVPVELIHGCLQIKTNVTPSNIGDGVENLASLLRLYPSETRPSLACDVIQDISRQRPLTAIIAYTASKDDRDLFEAFVEANLRQPRAAQVECLLVLGRFVAHMSRRIDEIGPDNPHGTFQPSPHEQADFWSTSLYGTDSTLAFYLLLSESLATYKAPPFSPWNYSNEAGLLADGLALYWSREGDPEELARRRRQRRASS